MSIFFFWIDVEISSLSAIQLWSWIRLHPDPVKIWIRPHPKALDPVNIRIRPDPIVQDLAGSGSGRILKFGIWCIPSHCHSPSLASVKSRLVLPFWYRLTQGSPGKRAVKRVCVCLIRWDQWLCTTWQTASGHGCLQKWKICASAGISCTVSRGKCGRFQQATLLTHNNY